VNRFTDHFEVVTTNNYKAIAISTPYKPLAHTKSSQSGIGCFLVTASTMAIPLNPDWSPFFTDPCTELTKQVKVKMKVKVKVTLRLGVYRQWIRLGVEPLETLDRRFFLQLYHCGHSLYVTSSLTRKWVCLLWTCLAFRQMYISFIWHLIEYFFLLHCTQVLCQNRLCRADHAYLTYLMLQRLITYQHGSRRKYSFSTVVVQLLH
jgi:hypothetical protein